MKNVKILSSCKYSSEYEIVLCEWETGRSPQFVTWEHKIDSEDYFFWGHYFTNELQAKIDYHQRCLDNLKLQVPPFGDKEDRYDESM